MKCNNGYNRRIFNKKDKFITQGREYIFNCLWNDDVTVCLQFGHSDTSGRLHLAFVYRLHPGSCMFCNVHRTVDCQRYNCRPELWKRCCDPVVHNEDLHHNRNTADKVNPPVNDRTYDFIVLHTDHAHDHTNYTGKDQSPECQLKRYF